LDADVVQISAQLIEALGTVIQLSDDGERPLSGDHLQRFVDSGEAQLFVIPVQNRHFLTFRLRLVSKTRKCVSLQRYRIYFNISIEAIFVMPDPIQRQGGSA
jgi:hypothetical protein